MLSDAAEHPKAKDSKEFTYGLIAMLNCDAGGTSVKPLIWSDFVGDVSTAGENLLPVCTTRLDFSDLLKCRIGAHSQSMDTTRWWKPLKALKSEVLLEVLRRDLKATIKFENIDVPMKLRSEALNREYKIQRDLPQMTESWIRKYLRDCLAVLMCGDHGSCEFWIGFDNDGAVIRSYCDENETWMSDPERVLPLIFPPPEHVDITVYESSCPFTDEDELMFRERITVSSALEGCVLLNLKFEIRRMSVFMVQKPLDSLHIMRYR